MSQRITEHPILGKPEKGELVEFLYDGKPLKGYEGEPIAAALKAEGVMVHRHTTKLDRPRGVFCAIGRCTDCVMVVNGQPNVLPPLKRGCPFKPSTVWPPSQLKSNREANHETI